MLNKAHVKVAPLTQWCKLILCCCSPSCLPSPGHLPVLHHPELRGAAHADPRGAEHGRGAVGPAEALPTDLLLRLPVQQHGVPPGAGAAAETGRVPPHRAALGAPRWSAPSTAPVQCLQSGGSPLQSGGSPTLKGGSPARRSPSMFLPC